MAVNPLHRYSNESERTNWDIYNDFELKKPFGLHGLYKHNSALQGSIIHMSYSFEATIIANANFSS